MATKRNKPIVELDKPNGKVVAYWESGKKACEAYNLQPHNISYNVKGITKQAKGHYFRYATISEIEQYSRIAIALDIKNTVPTTVEPVLSTEKDQVEIIPEIVISDENQINTLSNFERILLAGKKKLIDNSK